MDAPAFLSNHRATVLDELEVTIANSGAGFFQSRERFDRSFERLRAIDSRQLDFLDYLRSSAQPFRDPGLVDLREHERAVGVIKREIAARDSCEQLVRRADGAQVGFED